MRSIPIIIFWILALSFFIFYPTGRSHENLLKTLYYKEYYKRFLDVLIETRENELKELGNLIRESGCYNKTVVEKIREIGSVYKMYRKGNYEILFGISVRSKSTNCYIYYNSTCLCFYEEFKDPLGRGEVILVEEAGKVSRKVNISFIEEVSIGYFR